MVLVCKCDYDKRIALSMNCPGRQYFHCRPVNEDMHFAANVDGTCSIGKFQSLDVLKSRYRSQHVNTSDPSKPLSLLAFSHNMLLSFPHLERY